MQNRGYKKRKPGGRRKRKSLEFEKDPNMIYLDGVIANSLPGTRFEVKVERGELDDLMVECKLRTVYKLMRRFRLIRGDKVSIEINPNQELDKGTIVFVHRTQRPNPRPNQPKK